MIDSTDRFNCFCGSNLGFKIDMMQLYFNFICLFYLEFLALEATAYGLVLEMNAKMQFLLENSDICLSDDARMFLCLWFSLNLYIVFSSNLT